MFELRLSMPYLEPDKAKKLLEDIKKHPGCCDKVWINSLYGFPPIDKVREAVDKMKAVKKLFAENGFSVSLQISNTIGHGHNHIKFHDYSGLINDSSSVGRFTGPDGTVAEACFCPYDETFLKYIRETTKLYASIEPECVWVDDDMKMYWHTPVHFGCYCDDCVSRFNRAHGTNYTRETLVNEINYGDISVRKAYIDQLRGGLSGLTAVIADAVKEVSPSSRLAYQSGRFNHYLGMDYDCVLGVMHEKTGKGVFYRPGGGFYDDNNAREMLVKAMQIDSARAFLPDYVEGCFAEVENTPNVVFGKSFEGTAKEGTLYLSYGCNGLTFATMNSCETDDYDDRMLTEYARYRPYWDKLIAANRGTTNSGVGVYTSPTAHLRKLSPSEPSLAWQKADYMARTGLISIGLPVTNRFRDTPVLVINPETVSSLSDEDVQYLLTRPVLTDAAVLKALCDRGYAENFGASAEQVSESSAKEFFTAHPVNASNAGRSWKASFFVHGGIIGAYTVTDKDGTTEPLAEYRNLFTDENYGVVDAIVHTRPKAGKPAKWAVIGYSLWETIISSIKRGEIVRACDEICDHTMPAVLVTADKCVVMPHTDKDGKTVTVSLQSISIGRTGKLTLVIRDPRSEVFALMGAYRPLSPLAFRKDGGDHVVEIDPLEPYEHVTVFCG